MFQPFSSNKKSKNHISTIEGDIFTFTENPFLQIPNFKLVNGFQFPINRTQKNITCRDNEKAI